MEFSKKRDIDINTKILLWHLNYINHFEHHFFLSGLIVSTRSGVNS